MDKILVAIIVLLAVAYLFRRFYMTFKRKDAGCEYGSCASNCGQGAISCESCSVENTLKAVHSEEGIKKEIKNGNKWQDQNKRPFE